ncbi:hypothetical protein ASG73_02725 [Janibacter sp. Soil728]|uniref:SRPBCC family protein n=1 Tax=Janibacter sp. Soil728 TaxID=1736393 RepID=UPI0006FEF045|nr:SRPBCC family protein [Janibacter sp. Soil728]KRE39268.1 hypothetical protein ASG73_02725 [Janibacter sp. Soil728]
MRWRRNPLRLEEAGPASVDEVWRRYTTPELWAGWAPQIRGVEHPLGRIAPDGMGVVLGPLGLRVPFVVEAVDDDAMRWGWTPAVGPVRVRMRHGVDRLGRGSRAWVEIDAPRPLALPYAPIARLALRRLVAA